MLIVEEKNEIDCGQFAKIEGKITLELLAERIGELAEEKGIQIKISYNTLKVGSGTLARLSKGSECIVVNHANHMKDYHGHAICLNESTGSTFVKMYLTGRSNNSGTLAVLENTEKGIVNRAIEKRTQKKLSEENDYYECILGIIAEALETADFSTIVEIVRKHDSNIEDVEEEFMQIPIQLLWKARTIIYGNSVENHDVRGMLMLSTAYKYLDKTEKAINILKILVDENNNEAMLQLGSLYEPRKDIGPNVEKNADLNKSLNWYLRAAFWGNVEAYIALGDIYYYKYKDFDRAHYWYTKATKVNIADDSANAYLKRAKLMEHKLYDSKLSDEEKRRIAKSVERDLHYAFELVENHELRCQITTDLGLFYEYSLFSKETFQENIKNENPMLALYFYFIAMKNSDGGGFARESYQRIAQKINQYIDSSNFEWWRDEVLTPYVEEHDFWYSYDYVPKHIEKLLEIDIVKARQGDSNSIEKVIKTLMYNFSTYKTIFNWFDLYIATDPINGLYTAGKLYLEYAPHSENPDEYYQKAEEAFLKLYDKMTLEEQKGKVAHELAYIYAYYYQDEDKAIQYLKLSGKYNELDLCLINELDKKQRVQNNINPIEEANKVKKSSIKIEDEPQRNSVRRILIVGIVFFIVILAISNGNRNDYAEENEEKIVNNVPTITEDMDTSFEKDYQDENNWEKVDGEIQQETNFINSDLVIQEENNCFGEYLGIVNEEVHYADPNIGGYDYTYYSLDFGKECSLWCNYYAEDTIGEISVSCIALSGEFDWNNLVGKKIRVQGKVIDNARGDQMILVNDILEIIEK